MVGVEFGRPFFDMEMSPFRFGRLNTTKKENVHHAHKPTASTSLICKQQFLYFFSGTGQASGKSAAGSWRRSKTADS